jgi:hypothetical protein
MYNEVIRRARKPHKCCECGVTIAAGEQYQAVCAKWDGQFDSFCTCMPCVEIRAKSIAGLNSHDCCDLPCFTELYEYVSNGLPDTADLVAEMKARRALSAPAGTPE